MRPRPLPARQVPRPRLPLRRASLCALTLATVLVPGCELDLGPRQTQTVPTFGAIVYREGCQRVSFTEDLAARRQDPARTLDSSGVLARAFCDPVTPSPLPEDAAPSLRALFERRASLIPAVDATLPDALLGSFDGYLRSLGPLQDDGTVSALLQRSGDLLTTLGKDDAFAQALTRLAAVDGVRPRETAGALARSAASAPGLDAVLGSTLPLLIPGGAAREELRTLLRAGGFELRHLEKASAPDDLDRNARVLRDLLTRSHPDLAIASEGPLLLALRDSRGLPLLDKVVAPYAQDPQRPLAQANERNRFVTASGAEIPFVAPLPPLDPAAPGAPPPAGRTASGQAKRDAGGLLYQYADLSGSLVLALLRDANLLFAADRPGKLAAGEDPAKRYAMDIPFGLLRGVAPVLGTRVDTTKEKEGEALRYRGFATTASPALDLLHAAVQVLRYQGEDALGAPLPPGQGLRDALRSIESLMADSANEGKLARATRALLDAADEARKPVYDNLKLPDKSTLFDDLAPILARVFAVPGLAEDLVVALQDDHGKAVGAMMAQLMGERGYFFMRQLGETDGLNNLPKPCNVDADEAQNGLTPCGVVGEFGQAVDRAQPDSDATQDWRGKVTASPGNNRSAFQRLLHTLADTNGTRPFCNGRNASVFGGFVVFNDECDMFQVDNIAQFFLLSIASPALRRDPQTFAKQAASFREAIKNGRDCRCVVGDPDPKKRCVDAEAKRKCDALLTNIDDGANGDNVLAGLMGLPGFGRYPEPAVGARALFLDVSRNINSLSRTRSLLFNFVRAGDGSLQVDPADADNRKFRDANGKERLLPDEHNGVLFAMEKVRGPARFADGSANPFPNDNLFDAMRPLVDAFAKHGECLERDAQGACLRGQNAVQILADAMTVLHRHWPSARSSTFGRSFQDSYGAAVSADSANGYEPLLAAVLPGDLLPATSALSPVLLNLTVDGTAATPKALPLLVRLLRALMDPSKTPVGVAYRSPGPALRNDGKPAYSDATLTAVLGKDYSGAPTLLYLAADALAAAKRTLDGDARKDDKAALKAAVSDAIDQFMQVEADGAGGWRFKNRRIRPVSQLALRFLQDRLVAKQADLPAWSQQLESDLTDALTGPLAAALVDLGVKLDQSVDARVATYALLQQLLSPDKGSANLRSMAIAATDAVQLLLDDRDLVPIGKALAAALDPDQGPTDPALILAQRGRDLEAQSSMVRPEDRPVLMRVVNNLFTIPTESTALGGVYPLYRLSDILGEILRETPGQGGDFSSADYRAVLSQLGLFLRDEQRGLPRFIEIVRQRTGAQ